MMSFFMIQMNLGEIFCQFMSRSFLQPVADLSLLVDQLHHQVLIQVMSQYFSFSEKRDPGCEKSLLTSNT